MSEEEKLRQGKVREGQAGQKCETCKEGLMKVGERKNRLNTLGKEREGRTGQDRDE